MLFYKFQKVSYPGLSAARICFCAHTESPGSSCVNKCEGQTETWCRSCNFRCTKSADSMKTSWTFILQQRYSTNILTTTVVKLQTNAFLRKEPCALMRVLYGQLLRGLFCRRRTQQWLFQYAGTRKCLHTVVCCKKAFSTTTGTLLCFCDAIFPTGIRTLHRETRLRHQHPTVSI